MRHVKDVLNVTPGSFPQFVTSTVFALLRVNIARPRISAGVVDYLTSEYPGAFAFGVMPRDAAPRAVWWTKHFGALLGTVASTWSVPEGYYLFHRGHLVFRHSGTKTRTSGELGTSLALQLAGILFESGKLNKAVDEHERTGDDDAFLLAVEPVIQKLSHLEEVPRAQGEPSDGEPTTSSGAHSSSRPSPDGRSSASQERSPRTDNPFAVLGVEPNASDEELKRIFRQKVALNHPDKVAHLSDKLQQTADAETRRIKEAYESIMRKRKGA